MQRSLEIKSALNDGGNADVVVDKDSKANNVKKRKNKTLSDSSMLKMSVAMKNRMSPIARMEVDENVHINYKSQMDLNQDRISSRISSSTAQHRKETKAAAIKHKAKMLAAAQ